MSTTRTLAPERDSGRPADLAPLSALDRLALSTGLQLMLWSARHAQQTARVARRLAAQQHAHRETRDALLRSASFGLR